MALAEDWIRAGRCRRVVIVAADDATSDTMLGWIGAGFLASGAAATDEVVEDAALPFDRRRHGMILGMGAAGLVVESAEAARERGLTPICEVLGSVTANSAFHGTRLDVDHIGGVMEQLVAQAEARGVRRHEIAHETMFVSHETYTPARGGSAAAEIHALREVFGEDADRIVIANTKGFTGHPMGVGLEDVVAVKALETGVVPPVPNFRDPDPELGMLNLSHGGAYPVRYALRLAAGFGSQISLLLLRWTPAADGRRRNPEDLGYAYRIADRAAWTAWLRRVSGYEDPKLEVVQHRLRVADQGPAAAVTHEPEHVAVPLGAPLDPPAAPGSAPAAAAVRESERPSTFAPAAPPRARGAGQQPRRSAGDGRERACSRSSRSRPAIRRTCSTWISTSRPTWASTPSSRLRSSPRSARPTGSSATTRSSCATTPPSTTSSRSCTNAPAEPVQPAPAGGGARAAPAAPAAARPSRAAPATAAAQRRRRSRAACWRSSRSRPAIRRTCSTWISTSRPTWASTPSSRLRCSPRSARPTGSSATTRSSCATTRPSTTSSRSCTTAPESPAARRPSRAPAAEPTAAEPAAAAPARPRAAPLEAADAEGFPRRVPVPVLRPPLERCVATGVTLGEGSRVVLMPDAGGVGSRARRTDWASSASRCSRSRAPPTVEALEALIAEWTAAGPIHGVYWLPALDDEGPLARLDPADRREALRVRVKLLAIAMRALAEQVGAAGTFLVSRHPPRRAPRLRRRRRDAPSSAARSPASRRRSRASGPTRSSRPSTSLRAARPRRWPTCSWRRRCAIRAPSRSATPTTCAGRSAWSSGRPSTTRRASPTGDTVFLVTGAAGSIVSAIIADLAAASGGTFHLLDLVPEPDPADPDLARFTTDRDGLKRELADRIRERGERPTPKLVERELARIERARAALDAIEAIERAGGSAHWHQVDLTDARQVSAAVAAALEDSGRIDVLLHCAGLEISHFLPDKPQREFDLVFDVKADGWLNVLHALGDAAARDRDRVQLDRRALRQRRPDRLLGGQRPAVQERLEHAPALGAARAASRSTGPRGRASAWRAAARSRR